MSIETWQAKYPVFNNEEVDNLTLREVVSLRKEKEIKPLIWSARLSTGIFGLTDCPAGNSPHVPKGESEVVLALGDDGLTKLIDLGFIPCPSCHPENVEGFWDKASGAIKDRYPEIEQFPRKILDRKLIPFDSRRVKWEEIAQRLTKMPNRIYIPPNLDEKSVRDFAQRIVNLGFKLPPIGFYDHNSPIRFTEYTIR